MMALLPYFLKEDIQFSRQEAAKFYRRVFEMLTGRVVDDDAGDGEGEGQGDGSGEGE